MTRYARARLIVLIILWRALSGRGLPGAGAEPLPALPLYPPGGLPDHRPHQERALMSIKLTGAQEGALAAARDFLLANDLPAYAAAIAQREHIIEVRPTSYGVQHPIACRPHLLECPVEIAMSELQAHPGPPGLYVGGLPGGERTGLLLTPYAAHEAAGETDGDEREIRRVL